jgi:hypothetical protein
MATWEYLFGAGKKERGAGKKERVIIKKERVVFFNFYCLLKLITTFLFLETEIFFNIPAPFLITRSFLPALRSEYILPGNITKSHLIMK